MVSAWLVSTFPVLAYLPNLYYQPRAWNSLGLVCCQSRTDDFTLGRCRSFWRLGKSSFSTKTGTPLDQRKEDIVDEISIATGISHDHLLKDFRLASLAQKMSWLAKGGSKPTTKIADMAYCMIGILGNTNLKGFRMETRYDQGTNELQRLQIEIIKKWNPSSPFNESLFAWKSPLVISSGLLAPAPSCFYQSGDVVFDPSLAKSRHGILGKINGISFDETDRMSFAVLWIFYVPMTEVVYFATLGLLFYLVLLPASASQAAIGHRDVKLSC
jgi:hypothetical protein